MGERKRDEYGRAIYADHEIPPIDAHLALWRGRVTAGGPPDPSTRAGGQTDHERLCVDGWMLSGDWWLHCAVCRPNDETAMVAYNEAVARMRADTWQDEAYQDWKAQQ